MISRRELVALFALSFAVVLFSQDVWAGDGYWTMTDQSEPAAAICDPSQFVSPDAYAQCYASWDEGANPIGGTCARYGKVANFVDLGGGFAQATVQSWYSYGGSCESEALHMFESVEVSSYCAGADPVTGECPAACDGSITGVAFLRPVFSGGSTGNICHESSGCLMTAGDVSGLPGGDLVEYTGTDQGCTAEPVVDVPPEAEDAQCITSGGNSWCTEPDLADQNCGMLNGEYLCLDSIPDGQCTFFGNGSMACDSSATAPPAPDDGVTAGNVAAPDITINNNGTTVNVFGSSTVAGSTSGATGSDQQGDLPAGDGEEPGQGTGASSGSCDVAPSCTGDAIQCAILEQQWLSACQEVGTEGEILTNTGLSGYSDVEGNLGSSVNIDTNLDDAGWLSTRECMLDVPVDLGFFGAFTFEFSQWCPLFAFAGVFVLISAGIGSLRIIAGAF